MRNPGASAIGRGANRFRVPLRGPGMTCEVKDHDVLGLHDGQRPEWDAVCRRTQQPGRRAWEHRTKALDGFSAGDAVAEIGGLALNVVLPLALLVVAANGFISANAIAGALSCFDEGAGAVSASKAPSIGTRPRSLARRSTMSARLSPATAFCRVSRFSSERPGTPA